MSVNVGGLIARDFDRVSTWARRMAYLRPDFEAFVTSVVVRAGEAPIAAVQVDLQTPDDLPEERASWSATLSAGGWMVAVRDYGEESPVARRVVDPLESLRDLLAAADEYLAVLAVADGCERS